MNRRAARNAEVRAVVQLAHAGDGMDPHAVRRGDRTADRALQTLTARTGGRGGWLARGIDQAEPATAEQLERVEVVLADQPAEVQARA